MPPSPLARRALAASYDGSTSFGNVYGAGMAAAFSATAGTMLIWSNGAASAGTAQRLINLAVDANNTVRIRWNAGTGSVTFDYIAGGTTSTVTAANAMTAGGGFRAFAITWDKAADEVKAYVSGAQSGTTQTGLGIWAGSLSATQCCIGAASTSAVNPITGVQAHAALFARALTATEVASAATL